MAYFTLELVTPEKVVLKEEADQISVPTPDGEITILPHHIPLVTLVSAGELRVKQGNQEHPLVVASGFLEIHGKEIRVLTRTAERIEEIDEQRAEEAKQRAEQLQKELTPGEKAYAETTALLERNLARLRVAKKYRHRLHGGPVPHE